MSVAPKRSRFSDKPEADAVSAKQAKNDDTLPQWKTTSSDTSLVALPTSGMSHQSRSEKPKMSKEERRKLRKSKWSSQTVSIPGISTNMPKGLTIDQQKIYIKQLEIEEISRRLRSNDLGIPADPAQRSPSPEPVYSSDGKRLNTRDVRTRRKLEDMRHTLITDMKTINPHFMPPADYKPPMTRVQERVLIPQDEHPGVNFVGLLIGPRGNTLKKIEKDHECKVMIRGKGSVKVQSYINRPLPGEDEPLHALISANSQHHVEDAIKTIRMIIKDAIENPEGQNDLRKTQLMELARLNGTLREGFEPKENSWLKPENQTITNQLVCTKCGGRGHISSDCRSGHTGNEKLVNRQMDSEYEALMAELGGGKKGPLSSTHKASNGAGFTTANLTGKAEIKPLDIPSSNHSTGYGTGRDFRGGHFDKGSTGFRSGPAEIFNKGGRPGPGTPQGSLVTPDQYHSQNNTQPTGTAGNWTNPLPAETGPTPGQAAMTPVGPGGLPAGVTPGAIDPNTGQQFDFNTMMMMGMMMSSMGGMNGMAPPPPPPDEN